MILAVSLSVSMCFAQTGREKNYRFTFLGGVGLSGNIKNIYTEYYTNPDPPEQPLFVTVTANRKIAFGIGMRFEYNFRKKLSYSISGIMLDEGFGLTIKQRMTDNSIITLRDENGRLYFCLPVEVFYRFINNDGTSLYLKSGVSVDLNLHQNYNYNRIGSSVIAGIGMSFQGNDNFAISIEPGVRYALLNYSEEIQFVPNQLDNYKPLYFGLTVCLSQ